MSEMKHSTKAISGIVLLALSLAMPGVHAATGSAAVGANILGSLVATGSLDLVFGDLSAGPIPGSVIIATDGSRSGTGGVQLSSASPSSPATFSLVGIPNRTFAVTLPASILISDSGGNSMVVDGLNSSPSGVGQLNALGEETLVVGGTLNVTANQNMGSYSGVMTVTVDYN